MDIPYGFDVLYPDDGRAEPPPEGYFMKAEGVQVNLEGHASPIFPAAPRRPGANPRPRAAAGGMDRGAHATALSKTNRGWGNETVATKP